MPVPDDAKGVVHVVKRLGVGKDGIRRLVAIAENFGISMQLQDEEIDFIDSICKGRYSGEEGLLLLVLQCSKYYKKLQSALFHKRWYCY